MDDKNFFQKIFKGSVICNLMIVLILTVGIIIMLVIPDHIEAYKTYCDATWPFLLGWAGVMGGVKGIKLWKNGKSQGGELSANGNLSPGMDENMPTPPLPSRMG